MTAGCLEFRFTTGTFLLHNCDDNVGKSLFLERDKQNCHYFHGTIESETDHGRNNDHCTMALTTRTCSNLVNWERFFSNQACHWLRYAPLDGTVRRNNRISEQYTALSSPVDAAALQNIPQELSTD